MDALGQRPAGREMRSQSRLFRASEEPHRCDPGALPSSDVFIRVQVVSVEIPGPWWPARFPPALGHEGISYSCPDPPQGPLQSTPSLAPPGDGRQRSVVLN